MLQTIKSSVRFNESAIKYALSDQIEDLDELVDADGQLVATPSDARAFFAKTHVTAGMGDLMRLGMQRLGGHGRQGVFELRQAMGGGKTHSMLALGHLSQAPEIGPEIGVDVPLDDGAGPVRIVVINGRHISRERYLWGEVAHQLGRGDQFVDFWRHGPRAPNEKDWVELIGEDPVLILVDELPFYLKGAIAEPVAGGNLGDVTSNAVSNLFSASLKLPRLCIVVATLKGSYGHHSTALTRLVDEISAEAGRQAKPITPVELGSDEIYRILRKRLVAEMPPTVVVEAVSEAYSQAIADAAKSKTIDRSAATYESEIAATYPFHPSFKTVLATFKENEGFRQTRGLMTVAALMIRSALDRRFDDVYLVGPQHLDLEEMEVRDQINAIHNLDAAITQDVASTGSTLAHAQLIDDKAGNDAASQAGRLLVMASLAKAEDAVKGLTEVDLIGYLVTPLRPAGEFRTAVEELVKSSWYLHRREGGALYFSRNENLTKKIEQLAANAPENKIDEEIARRIDDIFKPRRGVAYRRILSLPTYEQLERSMSGDRTLVVLRPDNRLPPEEAQKVFAAVPEKNNFALIGCTDASFNTMVEHVREAWAVARVMQMEGDKSPNHTELTDKLEAAQKDAHQALAAAFDRIYFPSYSRTKGDHLSHVPLRLDSHRTPSNGFDGEKAVEEALTSTHASKLRVDIEGQFEAIRREAETILWPEGGDRRARKADIDRRMLTNPRWPWLPKDGIDQALRIAQSREIWIDHGDGWIEKGPFPPKKTGVNCRLRHRDDETGASTLAVSATVGGAQTRIHYSTLPTVSDQDPMVEGGIIETDELRLHFLALDPTGRHETGPVEMWKGEIVVRHHKEKRLDGSGTDVTIVALPKGRILYNTDDRTAREGQTYEDPVFCPADRDTVITVFAEADGVEKSDTIRVPRLVAGEAPLDLDRPARVQRKVKVSDTGRVFSGLQRVKDSKATFDGIEIIVGTGDNTLLADFSPGVRMDGHQVEAFVSAARLALADDNAPVEITWKGLNVHAARDLDAIKNAIGEDIIRSDVRQD